MKEIDDEDEHGLEELVDHVKNVDEAAGVVRRYEKILKTKYRGETRSTAQTFQGFGGAFRDGAPESFHHLF